MEGDMVPSPMHEFSAEAKEGVYHAIYGRRDIRSQFVGDPISEELLARILQAAHHAPSVGFMQPWNFIVIRDEGVRKAVHDAFCKANEEAAEMFSEEKRAAYCSFKLEGILESPVNICITCDRSRFGPVVVGRTHCREMDLYSAVCAVQNLWLAARAEGLGVGWVSIINKSDLKRILGLPDHIVPVAYLCIGRVTHFPCRPELEAAGWLPRMKLQELVYCDRWGDSCRGTWQELNQALQDIEESL
jgi:5,6-dimethylbenzimidazole synthase